MQGYSPTPTGKGRELLVLGETTFRGEHRRFGLLPEDRLRHLWILGKTGSGKSTLLANLAIQDLTAGAGFALLDPHGDLVDTALAHVPSERAGQVVLFAPEDREYPISFNVFRQGRRPHADTALLASNLVSVFRKHWSQFWGPRLEHILRNAVLAVAGDPRANLLFLYRFLTEKSLRDKVVARVRDPVVRQFWTKEFAGYTEALQAEAVAPALNKLGAFVAHPVVRNIVGAERSRLEAASIVTSVQRRSMRTIRLCIVCVLLAMSCSDEVDDSDEDLVGGYTPLSQEEAAALEKIRTILSTAESLRADRRLTSEQRDKLDAAVAKVRRDLAAYKALRERGEFRGTALAGISRASLLILADDATVVGTADNVLLVFCALAAIGSLILFEGPAPKDALMTAWRDLGISVEELSQVVAQRDAPGVCTEPRTAAETQADRLPASPGEPDQASDTEPKPGPATRPVPRQRGSDERRKDKCKAEPACPHLPINGDPIHHMCADEVPPNVHRGCDVLVKGKRFDALDPAGALWEIKTDDWSNYSKFLKERTFNDHKKTARLEHGIAKACRYPFVFAVADEALYNKLHEVLGAQGIQVRHVPQCRRKVKR